MSFQIDIQSDAAFKQEIVDTPGLLQVVEVYQSWCGPCKAVQSTLKKLFFDLTDRPIKFYTASADKVGFLRDYVGHSIPVFVFYKDGQQLDKVVGVVAPELNQKIMALSDPKAAAPGA